MHFRKAEEIQRKKDSNKKFLYNMWGLWYCELLLDEEKFGEVLDRADWSMEYNTAGIKTREEGLSLLRMAVEHFTMGQALLRLTLKEGTGRFALAEKHLIQAVDLVQRAGQFPHEPYSLMAQADFYRETGRWEDAREKLEQVRLMATHAQMLVHLADCHLGFAKLYSKTGEKTKGKASLNEARMLITRMGYGRRERDIAALERLL